MNRRAAEFDAGPSRRCMFQPAVLQRQQAGRVRHKAFHLRSMVADEVLCLIDVHGKRLGPLTSLKANR